MATTTNYSWTTPDDTDLVKDGAAAIRTLGSSADTTVKALNPGTTAGDVDYYTSSTAKTRLAIGTAGQVLQVNSGATAPEWVTSSSGGLTLLSTTTLSGATTNITSINQTYTHLQMVIENITLSASDDCFIKFNTSTSPNLSGVMNGVAFTKATGEFSPNPNSSFPIVLYTIFNYASTTGNKAILGSGRGSSTNSNIFGGLIPTNTAITEINFSAGGAVTYTGGTVRLYGVK